jgi:hypothetical protein
MTGQDPIRQPRDAGQPPPLDGRGRPEAGDELRDLGVARVPG